MDECPVLCDFFLQIIIVYAHVPAHAHTPAYIAKAT